MVRSLVLLLILPQLLLPPGMCLCRFVAVGKASASPSSSSAFSRDVPSASHAAKARSDCPCDSCRPRTPSADLGLDHDHPTEPPADGPAAPGSGKHWPGCPVAAFGAELPNLVVPTVSVEVDYVTADFDTPLAVLVVSPVRTVPASAPAVSPPLYISHCSLLI